MFYEVQTRNCLLYLLKYTVIFFDKILKENSRNKQQLQKMTWIINSLSFVFCYFFSYTSSTMAFFHITHRL